MWIYTIISIANPADQFRFKGAGFILLNDPKIFVLTCNGLKQPFILHKKPSRSECHPFFVHNILSATGVKHVKSFFFSWCTYWQICICPFILLAEHKWLVHIMQKERKLTNKVLGIPKEQVSGSFQCNMFLHVTLLSRQCALCTGQRMLHPQIIKDRSRYYQKANQQWVFGLDGSTSKGVS